MIRLDASDRLQIYTRYIGRQVLLKRNNIDKQVGVLLGVKQHAIQVEIDQQARWIPIYDDFHLYEIKLILKPLSKLTESIKQTANNLPIQNFITQYYVKLGFDMPVFISPGHPANCSYVHELGLADYREPEEILSGTYYPEEEKEDAYADGRRF